MSQDVIRCEATTGAGTHEVREGGLVPFGPSKDAPRRPQITVMMGSLEPLGRPLATDGLAGERADDGLSMPRIQRREAGLRHTGLRFVGDGKRSALDTRASGGGRQHLSLSPRPFTGATAEAMAAWREAEWSARVVVRSPAHAERQAAGLEKRLATAEPTRAALTPARGRGQRQRTAEAQRVAALAKGRKEQPVEGWLQGAWQQQSERHTHDVGRGRGSATRPQRVMEPIRSHLTRSTRQEGPIRARPQRCGWQAVGTHAPPARLSWRDASLCSRHAYRIERLCNRLKSRGPMAPLFVTRTDHSEGLTSLRTLGVRVLTVMELALRRSLQNDHAKLPGLHPENKTKMTDTPTAERILKACADVSLTIIKQAAGEGLLRRLTPLSGVQETILPCLGLGTSLYRQLEIQGIGN